MVAIFFTSIRDAIFITIWIAFIWNAVSITIGGCALVDVALIWDAIAVAIFAGSIRHITAVGNAIFIAVQ